MTKAVNGPAESDFRLLRMLFTRVFHHGTVGHLPDRHVDLLRAGVTLKVAQVLEHVSSQLRALRSAVSVARPRVLALEHARAFSVGITDSAVFAAVRRAVALPPGLG